MVVIGWMSTINSTFFSSKLIDLKYTASITAALLVMPFALQILYNDLDEIDTSVWYGIWFVEGLTVFLNIVYAVSAKKATVGSVALFNSLLLFMSLVKVQDLRQIAFDAFSQ